jgi:hypothetical protein
MLFYKLLNFYNDRILGQASRKIGESVGSISRGPTPVFLCQSRQLSVPIEAALCAYRSSPLCLSKRLSVPIEAALCLYQCDIGLVATVCVKCSGAVVAHCLCAGLGHIAQGLIFQGTYLSRNTG